MTSWLYLSATSDLASPKSHIFMVQSLLRSKFEGLRSRWRISAECKNFIPFASWYIMKRLWASLSIFCLNDRRVTLWRCEDQPTWTRRRGRDPCHFRHVWPGAIWRCWDALVPEVGWFRGRCAGHRWNVGRRRRSSWVPVFPPTFYL